MSGIEVRRARPEDAAVVVTLLHDLADYERLLHKFHLTTAAVARDFFGDHAPIACDLAFLDGAAAGIMTWYPTYSSFAATRGIYIEDFYVRPELRGRGVGRALIADLARRAVNSGAIRLEWAVLTWNKPSIAFYENLHAERVDDWHIYRLTGDALAALARE